MNEPFGIKKTGFSIKDYVRAFFRRKGLVLLGFMIVTPLVFPIIFGLPDMYRSQTTILIRDKINIRVMQGGEVAIPIRERVKTLRTEVLSWNSITRAMDAVGLSDVAKNPLEMERLVNEIKNNISFTTSGSTQYTDIINITFKHRDPMVTQHFLNVLTTNFIENSLKDQRVELVSAVNFVKEQIAVYEEKLKESDTKLIQFKKDHMYDLPNQRTTSANTILNLEMRKTDLNFELEGLRNEKSIQEQKINSFEERTEEIITPDDPVLKELQDKMQRLVEQLQNLELVYTELHPDVLDVKRRIQSTEMQIEERKSMIKEEKVVTENKEIEPAKHELSRIELKIATLESKKRRIERDLREAKEKLEKLPSIDEQYVYLLNENEAIKSVYHRLKDKLEAIRMTQHIETTEQGVKFEVLEPARLPLKPFSPNRWRLLMMGLLAGLIAGGGLAFLVEFTDHSFRGTEDARANLEIPLVGVIPTIITARERRRKRIKNFLFGCLTIIYLVGLGLLSAYVYKYYH
ncbi:MAG: XrtA system polysaccharide chain length determinant [Candidatus Auribacterota bacterium]|jgi:polysaccharide chain length determinant protein (PEP-CTERM system associated)|uniref:Tyrosine kinase G-rich domain-containing protein n=1 Tax=Candidatus Auribacter fodinae TaxID=2093366 RepID=A0A3A4R284_9BACT|nr:MAG: hypothetical protein C4541_04580 [Candidatus Auribacter fodinae]